MERFLRVGEANERFEECVLDIDAWIQLLKKKGYNQMILQGHSLGSAKVAYYCSKKPNPMIKGIVLASPPDMLGLVRVEKEKQNFERDDAQARELVSQGKGKTFLTSLIWGCFIKSAESYLDQFGENSKSDVFPILRNGAFKELESIPSPIYAFYGGKDDSNIFSPKKDLEVLAKHFTSKKSRTAVIGTASHVYFNHEKQVAKEITDWLKTL